MSAAFSGIRHLLPNRHCSPWQFGAFRLKVMYGDPTGNRGCESAPAVDVPLDLREKWRKVDLVFGRVHVLPVRSKEQQRNPRVAGKEV